MPHRPIRGGAEQAQGQVTCASGRSRVECHSRKYLRLLYYCRIVLREKHIPKRLLTSQKVSRPQVGGLFFWGTQEFPWCSEQQIWAVTWETGARGTVTVLVHEAPAATGREEGPYG